MNPEALQVAIITLMAIACVLTAISTVLIDQIKIFKEPIRCKLFA